MSRIIMEGIVFALLAFTVGFVGGILVTTGTLPLFSAIAVSLAFGFLSTALAVMLMLIRLVT